jgi:hypothetical protein
LAVVLDYEGETVFSSEDVTVPPGSAFSGTKTVVDGAICGSDYSFKGIKLGEVELAGLVRSLFGIDDQLEGVIKMKASVSGCGYEEEVRQMEYEAEEFGNLSVGRWRRVR